MMFGKNERKKGTFGVALAVGALAMVGAASITAKGKMLVKGAVDKMKGTLGVVKKEMN